MKGQRMPFPPSARVPIIGERPDAPPVGKYFYQVPALILREGQAMDADSFEFAFPMPLEGVRFKNLAPSIAKTLQESNPDLPAAKVVVLAPFFLGFVPQEELDRQAEAETAGSVVQ